ncbi:MAG: BlaI/MecI/CopY family transcriptional regulator [Pseudolysinimonas sp.]|jgi:predicted transcriptional regulator|uniref:BlaI/MecI/CopY family transcriptional regulator n=1 Tax=Pseudolysinimonas sp. TaxID=2680009 RepID=UPI003C76B3D6
MANLGLLERGVMQTLWDADAPLSAYDVLPLVSGAGGTKRLAVTTVLTVLSRLEKKGFVRADRTARPHRYTATASRADHVAELLHEALGESADRHAVLERFVGGVSAADAAVLRDLLARRHDAR